MQLSANTIEVKSDQAATGLVAKEDIDVSKADGTLTIPVNNMTLSDDGMSAVLELSVALQDKAEYAVSLNDSMSTFTASVGEVATVAILTSSAQQNVATPIEFKLFDETGVDVTSTVNVDATCSVSVDGNVTSDTSKASKSTITMDTVDDTATVTITYNAGELDSEDVVATGIITCVEPEAAVGMGIYADVDPDSDTYINQESKCAKFYWGDAVIKSSAVTVEVNESNDGIYFCAATAIDPDGVIAYDSYKVESSNEDVMSVTSDVDSGKFAQMTVSGNMVGSANIVITATKNGKDTPYTIPVTVTKTGVLSTVNYTVSRSRISNAIDTDYSGLATAYGVDTNNNRVYDADVTFSIVDFEKKGGSNSQIDENVEAGLIDEEDSGFLIDGSDKAAGPLAYYTAWNAKGGSRSLKATVSKDDIVKEKSTSITVEALPETIWANGGSGQKDAKLTYAVELGSSTIETPGTGTTARLAALYGGKFVGYVRQTSEGVSVGTPANGTKTRGVAIIENKNKDGYVSFTAPAGDVMNGLKITMKNAGVNTGSSITVDGLTKEGVPTGITYTYGSQVATAQSYATDYDATAQAMLTAAQASGDEDLIALAVMMNSLEVEYELDGDTPSEVVGSDYIMGGYDAYGSTVNIDKTTVISDVMFGVKYGNKYNTPIIPGLGYALLYNKNTNMQSDEPEDILNEEGEILIVPFVPEEDGSAMLVSGNTSYDKNFARPGSYTVEFRYTIGEYLDDKGNLVEGKEAKASTNLTVKNAVTAMIPTVNVKDRNVDSLDVDSIIENMSTLVDINNNTSSHESIISLYSVTKNAITGQEEMAELDFKDNSVNVKYAEVVDVIGGVELHFYVPINKTFYLK